jgi:hypothetical protein
MRERAGEARRLIDISGLYVECHLKAEQAAAELATIMDCFVCVLHTKDKWLADARTGLSPIVDQSDFHLLLFCHDTFKPHPNSRLPDGLSAIGGPIPTTGVSRVPIRTLRPRASAKASQPGGGNQRKSYYPALIPAARITLAHFSLSAAIR